MIRTITRLLFGRPEEIPEDVGSGEMVEEGWLIVTHQEVASSSNSDAALPEIQQLPSSDLHDEINADVKNNNSEVGAEPACPASRVACLSRHHALEALAQLTCTKKTKPWVDRHQVSRNAMKRQNQVRQAVHHSFHHLQQPATRGFHH